MKEELLWLYSGMCVLRKPKINLNGVLLPWKCSVTISKTGTLIIVSQVTSVIYLPLEESAHIFV